LTARTASTSAYASPAVLASFPAKTIFAQAAGSGTNLFSDLSSGGDIVPYIIGGGVVSGTAYEL
jgi:hypothetical protein